MRAEIGKYLLDVSKLVLGGVVLSTILSIEDFSKIKILIFGLIVTFILALTGFLFIKKSN